MKPLNMREYRSNNPSLLGMAKYLMVDLAYSLREISTVLSAIRFEDNFESFITTVTIPTGGADFRIRNELPFVPTKRIILRSQSGLITDGVTEWTKDYIYMRNLDTTDQQVTIAFMR